MAEVPGSPYEPFFTAQPTERPIQERGVNAPGAAFGENIANAIHAFGGEVQKSSNELFDRALALRRLQVEGQIRDLTTEYYQTISPMEEDFLKQQGNNASQDALNKHVADIGQTQAQFADRARGIGGLYGANAFGAEAASMSRNFMQTATRHSAQQSRLAADASIDARIGTIHNQMRMATTDSQMTPLTEQIAQAERERQGLWGYDDGVRDYKTQDMQSKGTAEYVKGTLRRDPEAGIAAAKTMADSGRLGPYANEVSAAASAAVPTATNRYLTSFYAGHNLDPGNRKISQDQLVDTIYQMEGHGRGPVIWNRRSQYYGQQALPGGVMPGNLAPWLKEAGMPSMTPEEYAANPDAQRQLMRFKLNQFQEQTGTANGAFSMWFTGRPLTPGSLGLHDQNITNQTYLARANQFLARGMSSTQVADAAENYGNSLGVVDGGERAREYAESHTYRQRALQREARDDLHSQFDALVINNPGKGWDEFQADPNFQTLMSQGMATEPDFVRRWPQIINSRVKAVQAETNMAHFNDLMKTYVEGDTQKFMDSTSNVWEDKQLGESAKMQISRLRGDLHRQGYHEPRISQIFKAMGEKYFNEIPNKQSDPAGYNGYLSGLYGAVEAYQEKTKTAFPMGSPEGIKAMEDIHKWLLSKDPAGQQFFRDMRVNDAYYQQKKHEDPYATDDTIRYQWMADQARRHFDEEFAETAEARQRQLGRFARGERLLTPPPTVGIPSARPFGPPTPPRQFGARGEVGARPYRPALPELVEPTPTEVAGAPGMTPEAMDEIAKYWGQMSARAREAEQRRQARRTPPTQTAAAPTTTPE